MEFLRKFSAILLISISSVLFAQTTNTVAKAFEESYSLEKEGEYNKAIKKIKTVYSADSYEINLRLGWLNYYAGFFTESTTYYQKAILLMPYSIEAKLGLINPLAALGNWNIVIKTYEKILQLDPKNSTANYRLGSIYYGKKDYNNAYKYYEKVVNSYPFDYDATLMFAWTNYFMGKKREAKILFNKVLLISPNDSSANEGLGLIK